MDQPVGVDLIKDGWHMTPHNGDDFDLAPGFTGGQSGNVIVRQQEPGPILRNHST